MSLLEVKNLHTYFKTKKGIVKAVNDVTYSLDAGKTLGIVGESGSGKSVSAMSIIKLLDGNGYIESGSITFDGKDILQCTDKEMYHIRGNEISVIFQEPMTSLNPVFTVERQIGETLQIHQNMTKKEARKRAVDLLADVKIPNPERVAKQYPFQLSGGMRQRVMIAMALACKPKLLIADEPTTALDVTIQAQILNLIKRLNRELDMTTILITHDLGVVATLCDKVVVMYGGLIMEDGTVEEIFYHPKHPYTMGLIDSIPRVTGGEKQRLKPIPGTPPNLIHPPKGCPFSTRCPYCMNVCMEEMPPYFQEDGHRTMCWLLHEEAPVNPEYVQRKEAMRRADG